MAEKIKKGLIKLGDIERKAMKNIGDSLIGAIKPDANLSEAQRAELKKAEADAFFDERKKVVAENARKKARGGGGFFSDAGDIGKNISVAKAVGFEGFGHIDLLGNDDAPKKKKEVEQ